MAIRRKSQFTDLRSLRTYYNRILEEQVIRPAISDLRLRREQIDAELTRGVEPAVEKAFKTEAGRVDQLIDTLLVSGARLESLTLDEVTRVMGRYGKS